MEKENCLDLNRVFEAMERGETPNVMEMLAALNEISDLNVGPEAEIDTSPAQEGPICLGCG